MTIDYTPLDSVLYRASLLLSETDFDKELFTEFATEAYKLINIVGKFQQKNCYLTITNHSATLPSDAIEVLQVGMLNPRPQPEPQYVPLHLSTSTITPCSDKCCTPTYTLRRNTILTTFKDAKLIVSYKGLITDDDGNILIPNDESLEQALLYYILYKYWLLRYLLKEEGSESRMNYFLSLYSTYSKRAQSLNLPSLGEMENLRKIQSSLTPQMKFDNYFNMGSPYPYSRYYAGN